MLIYFGNEISSAVDSRANAILQRGKMESSLYVEVWAIRKDGLIFPTLPGSVERLSLYMVGLHVDRLFLPAVPYG